MASRVAVWTVLVLAGLSSAAPSISFPINSQVPPVARIGQPFSFVFSPSTFSSSSKITYKLANSPAWLSIDGESRHLFGTPNEADVTPGQVVGVPINLVATDETGSTTLGATLVVSRSSGPKVSIPLEQQTPRFGVFSSPASVLTPPQTPISFDLAANTFSDPSGSPLNYYAVMADNTPLPAWISFDAGRLSFSGRTPPVESLIQPPQPFAFQVVASDVVGFAAASLRFEIVVGNHKITAERTTISLNATVGSPLLYTGLQESVKVDGKPATLGSPIIVSTLDIPPWLSVDKNTWHIGGTPPEAAKTTSFTVTLQDTFSDTLNLTILVELTGAAPQPSVFFKGDMPTLIATAGEHFSFDLGTYLANPQDTEVSVVTDASTSWVQFDANKLMISGDVPKDLKESLVGVTIQVKSKSSGKAEKLPLTMHIRTASSPGKASTTPDPKQTTLLTSTLEPTVSPTGGGQTSSADDDAAAPPSIILLAVLLPTLLLAIAVTCLLFWCFRRRKERKRPKLSTRDISGPLPGTFVMHTDGPFSHNYGSTQELGPHFHSSNSFGDLFTTEQKSFVESHAGYAGNADPAVPQPLNTVRLLPSIERTPSGDEEFGSMASDMTVTPLRLGKRELRNNRSLSYISETSIYEEHSGSTLAPDDNTLALLGNGSRNSFRDAVEVNIPSLIEARSIQPTPDSAHTGPRSSPRTGSSLTGSDPEILPLRTESRLDHYPPVQATGVRKFAWPWLRKNLPRSNAAAATRGNRKTHTRGRSMSTIDTFAYRRTPASSAAGYQACSEEGGDRFPTPSPPPRAASRLLPRPPTVRTSTRPVTRRGPPGMGQSFFASPNTSEQDTNPTASGALPPPPPSPSPISDAGVERDGLGIGTATNDNGKTVNYTDLVGKGPFHPSKRLSSTLAPGTAGGPGPLPPAQPAAFGEEWCDETVQSINQSQSQGSFELSVSRSLSQQPNWTAHGGGSVSVSEAVEESPVVGRGVLTGLEGGGKQFGSMGSDLMSPDKWPRAIRQGTGKRKTKGRGPGSVGGSEGAGLGGHSRSKGLSLASEASKGDESDYVVYI
ncbi:hypothetical protein B0T25DRAFT_449118 [Lasiosphaeria hispida]|uniref:Dystroglycan-type cadherin-like domain-containing protein n=1 Tax=Lasiosphaeria hispida TaxID=260671 RepID=A0AAJ0HS14_9PEZI|nr:hypothetical protein B0T25DRAFT_449118 [Lasiosphaeria hispida]